MTAERYQQIVDLFQKVLELDLASRETILAQACTVDEDLRLQVSAMLAAHDQAITFLEKSPDDLAAAVLSVRPTRPLIGQQLAGYEVISLLGSGGMGEVFLANDIRLGRKVALKLLPEGYATDVDRLRRFDQEARAISALNHPNIVTIYDIGKEGMITFLVTEFVPGPTLREQLATGPIPVRQAIDIAMQAAAALASAHSAGIVHRDIKPENIIQRPDGLVKILDFGLAKGEDPAIVSDSSICSSEPHSLATAAGTPTYMSPEQASGRPIDRRTDVFSLGCVLYELVTGNQTVAAIGGSDVTASVLTQPPGPAESLCPECPAALARIITLATKKHCDERYQTCDEMLADLKVVANELDGGIARESRSRSTYKAASIGAVLTLTFVIAAMMYRVKTGTSVESIAILPFLNESGADLQYLADGFTESLIGDLSQAPNLKVISRSSVFRYTGKDVDPVLTGAVLRAQAVLVGRIAQKDDRISVRVELVDVHDNHRLWGELYNCVSADLLQTQVEISKEILTKLRVTLSASTQQDLDRRQKIKPEAYRLYLRGKFYYNKFGLEDLRMAVALFHRALREDPKYALAYVALANCYVSLAGELPPKDTMPRAREYALKALELEGASAEAHVALGLVRLLYDWDWVGAEHEFKYDSRLNPEAAGTFPCYLHSGDTLGRTNEALAELSRQLAADPLSPVNNLELGCVAYYARQYDRAISQYWLTINLNREMPIAYANVGRAYVQKHRYSEAITELEKGRKLNPGWPLLEAELGYALAASGKVAAAREVLDYLSAEARHRYVDPMLFPPIYIRLGEPEVAFQWLEKAYKDRSIGMPWLKVDPKFDPIRSDVRYRDLLRRVGLGS